MGTYLYAKEMGPANRARDPAFASECTSNFSSGQTHQIVLASYTFDQVAELWISAFVF